MSIFKRFSQPYEIVTLFELAETDVPYPELKKYEKKRELDHVLAECEKIDHTPVIFKVLPLMKDVEHLIERPSLMVVKEIVRRHVIDVKNADFKVEYDHDKTPRCLKLETVEEFHMDVVNELFKIIMELHTNRGGARSPFSPLDSSWDHARLMRNPFLPDAEIADSTKSVDSTTETL